MTTYEIIKSDKMNQKSYGVKVIKAKEILNITEDYSAVKKLVDVCNKMEVSYEHFEDVLANFSHDFETF